MGRYGWVALLLLLALVVGVVGLFYVQNSARTTQLSLDLGFAAWRLQQPVTVPALVGGSAAVGFLLGFLPVWMQSLARGRRIKRLESQVALQQDSGAAKPW